MTDNLTPSSNAAHRRLILWIIGFAVIYDLAVFGLQMFQWFGSAQPVMDVDEYSAAVAIALCAIAIVLIRRVTQSRRLRALTIATAAVFAVLTIDDAFSIHERMNNDDYLAVALWLVAGMVLFLLLRMERPGRVATTAICTGFCLHGLAALADGADGGIFTLDMISPFELGLSKEILELAYIGFYILGFSRILLGDRFLEVTARVIPGALAGIGARTRIDDDDRELLEIEAWYWAWRSQIEAADTDDEGDRSVDELLSVVARLTVAPARSMAGVAAKLRVLRDMMESACNPNRREMEAEARLLAAAADDANRLAELGAPASR
jgi:hypothetical protein